jgi:hypothetical protein
MGCLILRLLGTPEVSHNVHSLDDPASFSASSGRSENQLCHTCWRRSARKLDLPEAKEDGIWQGFLPETACKCDYLMAAKFDNYLA